MFEALTDKLTAVFRRLGGKGRLTEKDIDEALREVRLALLEADVHFKVVRDFLARVKERAMGAQVLESIAPGQQVVKVVHDELTAILGGGHQGLGRASTPPTIVMLVGLQGSGKTTTAAKLARHLTDGGALSQSKGDKPLLVAADLKRPAAIEQLVALGRQLDLPVYSEGTQANTIALCRRSLERAREMGTQWVILDTGGRLHIDEEMMQELRQVKEAVSPQEVLLVVDSMTGQDAVRAAEGFHSQVGLTGLILTKLDGDARGGAALSITSVTGLPIKFIGTGERLEALEPFHPDRLASRILGMGDVVTLVEKAQATLDEKKALEMERKLRRAEFTLEDFLDQLQQLKKMGPISQVLEMLPGFSQVSRKLQGSALDDKAMKKVEAIVLSMTPQERRDPDIIKGSRKKRIARGSGTTTADVNRLLNQFDEMKRMLKQLSSGRRGRLPLPFGR